MLEEHTILIVIVTSGEAIMGLKRKYTYIEGNDLFKGCHRKNFFHNGTSDLYNLVNKTKKKEQGPRTNRFRLV